MSEAFQFRANEVSKLILVHKKLTLIKLINEQDSLIFELIYLIRAHPDNEILRLFMQHPTFEAAVLQVDKKPILLERCREFGITEMAERLEGMIEDDFSNVPENSEKKPNDSTQQIILTE